MSIEHVIIVTQKIHGNQKNISPHRNHDFHYFFVNLFVRTRYEKKSQFMLYTQKI